MKASRHSAMSPAAPSRQTKSARLDRASAFCCSRPSPAIARTSSSLCIRYSFSFAGGGRGARRSELVDKSATPAAPSACREATPRWRASHNEIMPTRPTRISSMSRPRGLRQAWPVDRHWQPKVQSIRKNLTNTWPQFPSWRDPSGIPCKVRRTPSCAVGLVTTGATRSS